MNYFIKTYGCQMNLHESEKVAQILCDLGYKECFDMFEADVIVFNTCCIRGSAEDKIKAHIGELKHLKKINPNLIVAIIGCMTQQDGIAEKLLKRYPFINIILGTNNISLLAQRIPLAKQTKSFFDLTLEGQTPELNSARSSFPNAWVNIIYGCNNFCTYCIVPYVRGRERSRDSADIIAEVRNLLEQGYKEITLLGQNVNSYGKDRNDGVDFAALLKMLAVLPYDYRLRFLTSHPKDLTMPVIETIAKYDRICKSIHLPVQSGSTRILAKMNRQYTMQEYFYLISSIKKNIPNVAITSDVIVGFPSETEQDFRRTLALVSWARFSSLFCFVYSRRKGTPAYDMEKQISLSVKTDRIKELINVQNSITKEISETYFDKVYRVLVEDENKKYQNTLCGRTDCGRLVNFYYPNNEIIGQFVDVKINKSASATLFGEIVKP